MQTLRHILVGIDFDDTTGSLTQGSRAAAGRALWLAGRTEAEIEFVNSTYRNPEEGHAPETPGIETGRGELEALLREHDAGELALVTTQDPPAIALTRRTLSGASDLLVVGKRNRAETDDRRLGSVSLQLIRGCPGPVWVVKPEHRDRHEVVLAATDLTPVGDRATEYAAFLTGIEGCELWVVHAWQMSMELQMSASRIGAAELESQCMEIAKSAREHILALPQVQAIGDKAHTVVAQGAPSDAILAVVEKRAPDLAVLGTISRGGVSGFLVGNTAERLLNKLDCSLLTVKPADFVCPIH